MRKYLHSLPIIFLSLIPLISTGQEKALKTFLSDSSMKYASVSFCILDADSNTTVAEFNSEKSLTPASIMKLITSGVAIEILGTDFRFTTRLCYSGSVNSQTGRLKGDIIIKGGGDPSLGSDYFSDHYGNFTEKWVNDIKNLGITRIDGRIITDDSYYDFYPVPPKWPWEDLGNYYGAGVYGLSVYDNTALLHFGTGAEGTPAFLKSTEPADFGYKFINTLTAAGTSDEGYVFAAPYSKSGWIKGTIPAGRNDFVLKASIADPPLLAAEQLTSMLKAAGIRISGDPATTRILHNAPLENTTQISAIDSPLLTEIINILNHESVNLYAETLLKQLGKSSVNDGSVSAGTVVVHDFLKKAGIDTGGMFIEDGSGLSPRDAINARNLSEFLLYMKKRGSHFNEYFASLPQAGRDGTLKTCFRDSIFLSRLRAKSGSMERVRCYAGYFKTLSGRNMIFTIMVNNFTGSSQGVIKGIEQIIAETISSN